LQEKGTALKFLDTICAVATPPGVGALAIIRVSGPDTFALVDPIFKGGSLEKTEGNRIVYGHIMDGEVPVDEVLISVFRAPRSFTGEDSVEISTHGSPYIVRYVMKLLVQQGCRPAGPGEFTQRAFLNGRLDLVQAEAVADLIAADSEAAHKTALNQLRGGFSRKLAALREDLIHFASLVELELDFGEEDVEFADRDDLRQLILNLQAQIKPLIQSFDSGNAIKEGFPVAIIGAPNAGKSTLLNALLNEDRAIVTDIAGTTRDIIEDSLIIDGIKFRFIDTAGIRETEDVIEAMGIERSKKALQEARLVLFLYDSPEGYAFLQELQHLIQEDQILFWVRNKTDLNPSPIRAGELRISARENQGIEELKAAITAAVGDLKTADTTITNVRHFDHLSKAFSALDDVLLGLHSGITGDFLAQDIRLSLHHLGEITGTISTDDLLKNIFGKFCIGK
jgi:tRNA modification GTPase